MIEKCFGISFDETHSLLVCVAGSKDIWLAPPGTEHVDGIKNWFEKDGTENKTVLDYNPSKDIYRTERWKQVHLIPGECLFLPRGWWHDVHSPAGTVAVSINLTEKA